MIDDKKIEAAKQEIYEDRFLLNGEEVVFDNDAKEEMFYEGDIKEAIGLGAKWAINEFLKDLWHQTDEEPERMKEILAYGFYGTTIVRWCPNGYITWKDYYEKWHYTQWLYVSDLLPKEGGEQ